ncbi:MAG: hypothetical protein AAF871_03635 [Pseudomonadota bacterium]
MKDYLDGIHEDVLLAQGLADATAYSMQVGANGQQAAEAALDMLRSHLDQISAQLEAERRPEAAK